MWIPKKHDRIESKHTLEEGDVIEVNEKWGWFRVRWDKGMIKEYSLNDPGASFIKIKDGAEIRADYLLRLENSGLTDYWRE